MAQVKFWRGSADSFATLTKDENTLYFINNNTLYRGSNPVGVGVLTVADFEVEEGLIASQFYVHATTGEFRYFDGEKFIAVGPAVVKDIEANKTSDDVVPTAKAVADYVDTKVDAVGSNAVSAVTYDNAAHKLSVTNGASNVVDTNIAGLVTDVAFTSSTGEVAITLSGADATPVVKTFSIPLEQVLTGAEQHTVLAAEVGTEGFGDAKEGDIGILMTVTNKQDNSTVQYFVSLVNFIDVYTTGSAVTDVVKIIISDDNKISASLALSDALYVTETGELAVDIIGMDQVEGLEGELANRAYKAVPTAAGNLAKLDDEGNLVDSEIAADEIAKSADKLNKLAATAEGHIIIGGADALTVEGSGISINSETALSDSATTIATESVVKAYVDEVTESLNWIVG